MKRKGLLESITLAVIIMVMAGTIASLGVKNITNVGGLIRSESVGIMGERIESAIYGISAFKEAQIEMEFQEGSKYKIYREEDSMFLEYTYSGDSRKIELESPYDTSLTIEEGSDEKPVNKVCLRKSEYSIKLEPGGCSNE